MPFGVISGRFTPKDEKLASFAFRRFSRAPDRRKAHCWQRGATKAELLAAADRHVLDGAVLVGNYAR
jgi:hypothetical protein